MHYLLFYDYVADYMERRIPLRSAHLAHAWAFADRGELLVGGAFAEPADGALIVFRCDSAAVPEEFARNDPYVLNGLVARWVVRPWTTVVGELATNPLREV
jgi:hypothetical protein